MRPWLAPASVSVLDDTSAPAPLPGSPAVRPRRPAASSCPSRAGLPGGHRPVTSTRRTPSQLWQTRLNNSGRTIWRAIGLPVSAALTRHDCSHHSSAGPRHSGPQGSGASHQGPGIPANPPVRDTVVAGLRSGLVEACGGGRDVGLEHLEALPAEPSNRHGDDDENRAKRSDNASHADSCPEITPARRSGIATAALITVKMPPKMRPRLSVSVRSCSTVNRG